MFEIILKVIFIVSFFLIIYSFILYPLLIIVISWFKKPEYFPDNFYEPDVSIIIAAYNEEKVIEDKIKNCYELEYPSDKLEIIIVSDASSDGTEELAKKFEKANLKLLRNENRKGKAYSINRAVETATGEVLVFTDANTMFEKRSLLNLVCWLKGSQVGGVCGELKLKSAGERYEPIYWRYETFIKRAEGKIGSIIGANGSIFAITKILFEKLPENQNIPDDFVTTLNVLQKKKVFLYEKKAIGYELSKTDLNEEFERKKRIAIADYNTQKYILKTMFKARFSIFFFLLSHKLLRWYSPVFIILLFLSFIVMPIQAGFGNFFNIVFFVLFFIYLISFICFLLSPKYHRKFINLGAYPFMINVAMVNGLLTWLFGRSRIPYWETNR